MIEFKILKKSKKSGARVGVLKTAHGEVETPAFVGVATQGVVKTLTSEEAKGTGCQLLICNTYHLHLKPGEKMVKAAGGLHDFMHWDRPLMTDSGGYQVFSLGFGKDYGTGKILKQRRGEEIGYGQQPKLLKLTDDGVWFTSFIDGKKLFLGTKESVKMQEALGADVIYAFDECTSPIANHEYTKKSLERTHKWAKESLDAHKTKQVMYGIVQGGKFKDMRTAGARYIGSLPFDGFGIGGEFGNDKREMTKMLGRVMVELPENKPRHLLGIGHLDDMSEIIKAGIDTFDCTLPTHAARHGTAFTSAGKLDMRKTKFLKEFRPLDRKCACGVCTTYTRAYICHLLKAKEITALSLLTTHNLFFFNNLVASLRERIKRGTV